MDHTQSMPQNLFWIFFLPFLQIFSPNPWETEKPELRTKESWVAPSVFTLVKKPNSSSVKLIKCMPWLPKIVNQSTELIWLIHRHHKTMEHSESVWAKFSTVEHSLITILHPKLRWKDISLFKSTKLISGVVLEK